MELTEEKIYDYFGVRPESEEQAQDDEPAPEGAAGQELPAGDAAGQTDPETDGGDSAGEDTEEDEGTSGSQEGGKPEQTAEERRQNAARRRLQEQQAAIDAAVRNAVRKEDEKHAASMAEFFRKAGLSNPYTKQPITSMEEFEQWHRTQSERRMQQELKDGKLTTETIASVIEQSPALQPIRKLAEQAQQDEQARKQEAFDADVKRQLEEIRQQDPSIREIRDILDKPYGRAFYEAVQRGNNFTDAWYLATRKTSAAARTDAEGAGAAKAEDVQEAMQRAAASASQRTLNNVRNKDHLQRTSFGGKTGAAVTDEEKRMYRLFNQIGRAHV